jgi:CheY-like chemotaxis protein
MAKTILVTDDNEHIRMLIKMTLQFKGYQVIEAEDGNLALQVLGSKPVDLLISDIAMPNMTGIELIAKLRSDPAFQNLPVIMCSAEREFSEEDLLRRGANAVLPKPFQPSVLLSAVQKLVPTS